MPISRPGISVIIPAYNAGRYLEETVQSVREQQWEGPLEIIVVNDGSSDGTEALAKSLGCRVVSIPQSGPATARNEGIKNASYDLIFFLDAAAVLAEGCFEALYAPMAKDPDVSAVFGKAKDFISPDVPGSEAKKIRYNDDGYEGRLTGCSFLKKEVIEQMTREGIRPRPYNYDGETYQEDYTEPQQDAACLLRLLQVPTELSRQCICSHAILP